MNARIADDYERRLPKNRPVMVVYEVDRDALAKQDTLAFVYGVFDAEDFWSLVFYCRTSGPGSTPWNYGHNRIAPHDTLDGNYYDIVIGPVAAFWQQRTIYSRC
jgi:hypothetical protein